MLNFLYATDLHGSIPRYEKILEIALSKGVKLIHLGADLLPKGSHIYEIQKDFINKYLKSFYHRCKENSIDVLAFFGNDDVSPRKKYFKKFGTLLDEVPFKKAGFEFKAYGYVPDYKFGNKTSCKLDSPGWVCPDKYTQTPSDFTNLGIVPIENPEKYFLKKGTIQDDLKRTHADDKTIMAIHCPPSDLELDVCRPRIKLGSEFVWAPEKTIRKAGSKAIYNWLEREKPLLCLCGHIHENYALTKVWRNTLGRTEVIQPGQFFEEEDYTRMVSISIDKKRVLSELLEIPTKGVKQAFQDQRMDTLFKDFILNANWLNKK